MLLAVISSAVAPKAATALPVLPGLPRGCAGLLQLVDADRPGPRDARGSPRLLRTGHVATRFLEHYLLRRGVGHGPVDAEIHQVRQHPDRLGPLARLPLVVPVDQHAASFQGPGPLDQRPPAVGVLLLGTDRLALARRQAQREQATAARFLDLNLLQERDEGPC